MNPDDAAQKLPSVVDGFRSVLQASYTDCSSKIYEILTDARDVWDEDNIKMIGELASSVSEAIEAIKFLKKIHDLPTDLFMIKFKRYCKGLSSIPVDKRVKYSKKVEEISKEEESLFILNILNQIEDVKK